jgi:uncharacterized protein (TIGR02231 family)
MLSAGQTRLEFVGVSPRICENAIRIGVPNRLSIKDVTYQIVELQKIADYKDIFADPVISEIDEEISTLKNKKLHIQEQLKCLDDEKTVLDMWANGFSTRCGECFFNNNTELTMESGDVRFKKFMGLYQEESSRILETRVTLQREMLDIDEQLSKLQDQKDAHHQLVNKDEKWGVISATISSDTESSNIDIVLSYIVLDAMWSPRYSIQIKDNDSKIEFHYNAVIKQMTCESWKNVSLRLSTAKPRSATTPPECIKPWLIGADSDTLTTAKPVINVPTGSLFGMGAPAQVSVCTCSLFAIG